MASLFERARFSGSSSGSVKKLAGFLKHHRVPESASPATQAFVARAGAAEAEARAAELFAALRRCFGYKRRELEFSAEAGRAAIHGPAFTVQVRMELDEEQPALYLLTCEVGDIQRPEAVRDEAFAAVFDQAFHELLFESPVPIDVEGVIDRIEEADQDMSVDYPPDAGECTVTIEGFPTALRFEPRGISLVSSRPVAIAELLRAADLLPRLLGGEAGSEESGLTLW